MTRTQFARLVRFESPATRGVIAWCLELHDLWVSKAVAGRPKDIEFCQALLDRALVERGQLRDRLAQIEVLDDRVRGAVQARVER